MRRFLSELLWVIFFLVSLAAALAQCVAQAVGAEPAPERRYQPREIVPIALAHARTLDPHRAEYARYISLHATPAKERPDVVRALNFAVNSLNPKGTSVVPVVPLGGPEAPAVYVDLKALYISVQGWENLGKRGSGSAPFPDPFFHEIIDGEFETVEERYWNGGVDPRDGRFYPAGWYKERTVNKAKETVAQARHLPAAQTAALVGVTQSESPILEARWFLVNALIEPRYHELLGLGETFEDFKRLAGVDEQTADKLGSQVRGIPILSEVAHRVRVLERTPTPVRYGRGVFAESLDFKTSVRRQDALADLLLGTPDARELICTLPNGLQAYLIVDGAGKRLNFADPEVAIDGRTRLKDKLVWTARNCMGCHDAEKGMIPVEDEVRATTKRGLQLISDRVSRTDPERGKRIADRFISIDINELLAQDQAFYSAAVKGVSGLEPAANGELLQRLTWEYSDRPVTLIQLAREAGASPGRVKAVLEAAGTQLVETNGFKQALDHSLIGITLGRKQRRDQIEAALPQVLYLLSQAK